MTLCARCGHVHEPGAACKEYVWRARPGAEHAMLCPCLESVAATPPTASAPPREEAPRDDLWTVQMELTAVVKACCEGYGDRYPYMGMHDAAKRLYRMGYRKVAEPELNTCRRCGAENVVTAQSVCIKCVGLPSYPLNHV